MNTRSVITYLSAFAAIFVSIILAVGFFQSPKVKATEFNGLGEYLDPKENDEKNTDTSEKKNANKDTTDKKESLNQNVSSKESDIKSPEKSIDDTVDETAERTATKEENNINEPNDIVEKETEESAKDPKSNIIGHVEPTEEEKSEIKPAEPILEHERSPIKNTHNEKSSLGINTNEVFEQDASIPFVDLFRVATPWLAKKLKWRCSRCFFPEKCCACCIT